MPKPAWIAVITVTFIGGAVAWLIVREPVYSPASSLAPAPHPDDPGDRYFRREPVDGRGRCGSTSSGRASQDLGAVAVPQGPGRRPGVPPRARPRDPGQLPGWRGVLSPRTPLNNGASCPACGGTLHVQAVIRSVADRSGVGVLGL